MTLFTATLDGIKWYFNECPLCHGSGVSACNVQCRRCSGRGYVRTLHYWENPQRDGKRWKISAK